MIAYIYFRGSATGGCLKPLHSWAMAGIKWFWAAGFCGTDGTKTTKPIHSTSAFSGISTGKWSRRYHHLKVHYNRIWPTTILHRHIWHWSSMRTTFPVYFGSGHLWFFIEKLASLHDFRRGSNVLFTVITRAAYCSIVLKALRGCRWRSPKACWCLRDQGEVWHNFVMWSVGHELWGLGNLALIPGTVEVLPHAKHWCL